MSQGEVKHPETDGRLKDNKDMPPSNRSGKQPSQHTKGRGRK